MTYIGLIFTLASFLAVVSCAGEGSLQISYPLDFSGHVLVTTTAADTGGPSQVNLFSPQGKFVRTLVDIYVNTEYISGLAYSSAKDELLMMTEGTYEQVESIDFRTSTRKVIYSNVAFTANPFRFIAVGPDQSVYIAADGNDTIEKIRPDSDQVYSRVGAPFISTTTGACVLGSPWGVAYIPSTDQIAVANASNTGITIYNSDGTCVRNVTSAPFNNNSPVGVAFHALSSKLIVSISGSGSIYSMNLDGTNITLIYSDTSIISTPRGVATDSNGNIYVANIGRDTVEKLYYSGSGTATRTSATPFIGPSGFSRNPGQVVVIP